MVRLFELEAEIGFYSRGLLIGSSYMSSFSLSTCKIFKHI